MLISLSAVAAALLPSFHLTQLHLLHVVGYHHVLPGRKQSLQLVHQMLW